MQYNLQHSLITHIADKTGIKVVWIYDGVKLPTTKPFITVEQMQNNTSVISKQREAVRTIYRFQIGLFASSVSNRALKQGEIKRVLLFDNIELLDATTPGRSLGFFYANITAEVPMPAEDISNDTQKHRVYFDVEIDVTFNKNTL
ncbi:hypothetical protein V7114_06645 [Neobacillus niacini]|uniref:hypothetical protein n=1 Tax=Neobacillus niacini TaxID=86668 RepID=UPI0030009C78